LDTTNGVIVYILKISCYKKIVFILIFAIINNINMKIIKLNFRSLIVLFLLISNFILAQEKYEYSDLTPRQTVKSHLYFLQRENYNPTISSYTIAGNFSRIEKEALAVKLKDILLKHKINVDNILDKKWSIVNRKKYVLFSDMPELYLARKNGKWQYSEQASLAIDSIHSNYYLKIKKANNFHSELENIIKQKHFDKKKLKTNKSKIQSTNITSNNTVNKEIKDNKEALVVNLSTPYNTIVSHLIFLEDSLFRPDLAAKTINFTDEDSLFAEDLAIKLKQIYLGANGFVFDIEQLSKDTNFIDTVTNKHIYYPNINYPKLYLEKVGDKWLYSHITSKLINSVHKDMYSEDADQIFSFSDSFKLIAGINKDNIIFYNLKLWQIYMLLYFFIIWLIIYLVNLYFVKFIILRVLKNSRYNKITFKIIKTLSLIIFWYITRAYLPSFGVNMDLSNLLHKFVNVFIIFQNTLISIYIVDSLKLRFTKDSIPTSTQGLIIFMSLIVKTIIFITSLLFFIKALDFNLVNVLAGLSIGGFALALGAQDTIKNFFGSLMIFADKQFSVGDYISSDKISGTVEEVGLRTTKIRTFHNSVVVVPNSKLADNSLDNMGRREYRRYKGIFVIKYDTPTDLIESFINKIKEEIAHREDTRKDFYMVHINDFSTYGLEMLVYVFFAVPEWEQEMNGKHELIAKILDFAKELNIEFAIPPK